MANLPAWPIVAYEADFTQGPPNLPGPARMSLTSLVRRNAVQQVDITRGRQYELDQVQAGTATLKIVDPLEYLNPLNPASPFMTGGNTITSYRCIQIGAYWNSSTANTIGNVLNSANPIVGTAATGVAYTWDPSFETFVTLAIPVGVTTSTVSSPADGGLPVTKAVAASGGVLFYRLRTVPNQSYTIVADVYASTGVTVQIGYYINGVTTFGTSTTAAGVYQALSGTFTASAAGYLTFSVTGATGGYPATYYVAGIRCVGIQPGWALGGSATMRTTTTLTGGAHTGFYALSMAYTAIGDSTSFPLPTVPGQTYTFSSWCNAQGSGSVEKMTIGAASVSTTTTATWQRLSITFTATDASTTVTWTAPSGTYPVTAYIDDIQLEFAASASTFTTTGPTYFPLYTGYIETYPLQYELQGTLGTRPLTCVDALSVLSRTEINQAYATLIPADGAAVFIPFNDAAFPQTVDLYQGGFPFSAYTSLGTNGQVSFSGDTFLDGSSTVSLTQQNATPPVSGNTSYITYLGTGNGSFAMNPQSFTLECWVKFTSGTTYFGAAAVPPSENPNIEGSGPVYSVGWYTGAGTLFMRYNDPNGGTGTTLGFPGSTWPGGFPDDKWHYLAVVFPGSSKTQTALDGSLSGTVSLVSSPSLSVSLNNLFIDATTIFGDTQTTVAVANMALYSTALSATQISNHYQRGIGYLGEISGTRVARLLTRYWAGPVSVAAGHIAMAADYTYSTRFMLDVLQEIQETERGLVYANSSGTVVFEDSTSRYVNNPTALWVLGENPTGASPAEYPYSQYAATLDPTYTFSQTNLTRPDNSNFLPLPSPLPPNPPYGQRILSQEVQVTTDADLTQASVFYLSRYGTPKVRITTLTLNPAGNPALWPVVLGLEISQRITVNRRAGGLTTSNDYYIEQIVHHIDANSSTWTVDLQCSPVFNTNAWILGDATYGVLGTTTIPVY